MERSGHRRYEYGSHPMRLRVEFTVEPFVDGLPGAHVMAAIDAVAAAGLAVDMGPFGTTAEGDAPAVIEAVRAMLERGYAAGATRITLQVTAVG